jgi:hypothetical protein
MDKHAIVPLLKFCLRLNNLYILRKIKGVRCQLLGSKVQRSKVQRLDNGRSRSDVEGQNPWPFNL